MSSLLCVKQPGGTLHIHNNNVISSLVSEPSSCQQASASHIKLSSYSSTSAGKSSSSASVRMSSSTAGQTDKPQNWLDAKTVKALQDRADTETRSARQLYVPLLETEDTLVKDVDGFLEYKDILELRKREMLHKNWSDRVYEPLRQRIITEMDGYNWPNLDRRKREMHKQYLEFVNRKGHVFLDIIDTEEYYPMALNGHRPAPLKIETRRLRDPLLSQGSQRNDEDRTVLRCMTGNHYTDRDVEQIKLPPLPLVPLGRHGTECATWLSMPLHNIESTDRLASRRRMRNCTNYDQMNFEAWAKAPFDPAVIDEEMQTQKKRMFKERPSLVRKQAHFALPTSSPHMVDVATCTE